MNPLDEWKKGKGLDIGAEMKRAEQYAPGPVVRGAYSDSEQNLAGWAARKEAEGSDHWWMWQIVACTIFVVAYFVDPLAYIPIGMWVFVRARAYDRTIQTAWGFILLWYGCFGYYDPKGAQQLVIDLLRNFL